MMIAWMMISGASALKVRDLSSHGHRSLIDLTSEMYPATLISNVAHNDKFFSALGAKHRSSRPQLAEPYNLRLPLIIGMGLTIFLLVVMVIFTFCCVPIPKQAESEKQETLDLISKKTFETPTVPTPKASKRLKASPSIREAVPIITVTSPSMRIISGPAPVLAAASGVTTTSYAPSATVSAEAQQFNMATPAGTQRFDMATPQVSGLGLSPLPERGGSYAKGWLAEQGSIAKLNFATSQPVTSFERSQSAGQRMEGANSKYLGGSV